MKQNFKNRVYEVVRKIPCGKVLTYKRVAELVGSPKAYRAVGNILNKNQSAGWRTKIPCHRVICSDGRIGGYNKETRLKALLLKKEGVRVRGNKPRKIVSRSRGKIVL